MSAQVAAPLLELRGVGRDFCSGGQTVSVLDDINLVIEAGEMVAIVGASGSGKSTLMNLLGCLDRPTRGRYRLAGRDTHALTADELACLRREHVGFIFQRYHLLPGLDALGNVEIPALYAGVARPQRRRQAAALLRRLGLGERLQHRPAQLSGGQQQRVGIARALINGAGIILADEPTGALDSQHGKDVLALLSELHADGHTVVIVTHDARVAEHAQRIIEIRDGRVVGDRRRSASAHARAGTAVARVPEPVAQAAWLMRWERLREAAAMALRAMQAHRLRTLLTMLGIIIGIASVVAVVALGEGSRQRVMRDIGELGTDTLEIYPGSQAGAAPGTSVAHLTAADADAIARGAPVDSVAPLASASTQLRYGSITASVQVNGVGEQFFRVKGMQFAAGQPFTRESVQRYAQEAVIDRETARKLFGRMGSPLGQVLLLGSMPVRIVGVVKDNKSLSNGSDSLNVWVPYSAVQARLGGTDGLQSIVVRLRDAASAAGAEAQVTQLLRERQGGRAFFISNNGKLRKTIEDSNGTLNLLITSIALISLLVGGIGVMNIMLVSVSERTREIGVRMAVGARQGDILQQFLIEAVLVCLIGGVLGIVLALGTGLALEQAGAVEMIFSAASIVAAFATCSVVGVLFGFVPARNAARLDPADALARES